MPGRTSFWEHHAADPSPRNCSPPRPVQSPVPGAHVILWLLGAFIALWSASLIVRILVDGRQPRLVRRAEARPVVPTLRSHRRTKLAVGVVLLIIGLALLPVAEFVRIWSTGQRYAHPDVYVCSAGSLLLLAFAGACLWVGRRFDPSRGRRRCPKCWYDMAGLATLQCPECGHKCNSDRDLLRTRPNRALLAGSLPLALLAFVSFQGPLLRAYGWTGFIPTTALIAGFEWLPEAFVVDSRPRVGKGIKGSLEDRRHGDTLWKWQQDWLEYRCRSVARRTSSRVEFSRATSLSSEARAATGPGAVHAVLRGLASPDPRERSSAADEGRTILRAEWERHGLETDLTSIVPAHVADLANILSDPDRYVRSIAVSFLTYAGRHADPVLGRLVEAVRAEAATELSIQTRSTPPRHVILSALAVLARRSDPAMAALQQECSEGSIPYRAWVLRHSDIALRSCRDVPPLFISLLLDPCDELASAAAVAIARSGPRPPEVEELLAVQVLTRTTCRDDFIWACEFAGILDPTLIPSLVESLGDPDDATAQAAACLLGKFGPTAGPALRAMRSIANDPRTGSDLRSVIDSAISQITGVPQQTEPDL